MILTDIWMDGAVLGITAHSVIGRPTGKRKCLIHIAVAQICLPSYLSEMLSYTTSPQHVSLDLKSLY